MGSTPPLSAQPSTRSTTPGTTAMWLCIGYVCILLCMHRNCIHTEWPLRVSPLSVSVSECVLVVRNSHAHLRRCMTVWDVWRARASIRSGNRAITIASRSWPQAFGRERLEVQRSEPGALKTVTFVSNRTTRHSVHVVMHNFETHPYNRRCVACAPSMPPSSSSKLELLRHNCASASILVESVAGIPRKARMRRSVLAARVGNAQVNSLSCQFQLGTS